MSGTDGVKVYQNAVELYEESKVRRDWEMAEIGATLARAVAKEAGLSEGQKLLAQAQAWAAVHKGVEE
jgi:hypothetical protein